MKTVWKLEKATIIRGIGAKMEILRDDGEKLWFKVPESKTEFRVGKNLFQIEGIKGWFRLLLKDGTKILVEKHVRVHEIEPDVWYEIHVSSKDIELTISPKRNKIGIMIRGKGLGFGFHE